MTILITGATGQVGTILLAELPNFFSDVRIMARNPGELPESAASRFQIVAGDFSDRTSLDSALQGVEKAFLLMGNTPSQIESEKAFVDAAVSSDVQHLVKMSAIGADKASPIRLKKCHGLIEECIESSGLVYTHIRPNFFMQNLLNSSEPIVLDDSIPLPMGTGAVGAIDVRDVAYFALTILSGSQRLNESVEISGPDILTFESVAQTMSTVLGSNIKYVDIDMQLFQTTLRDSGQSDWHIGALSELFGAIGENKSARITTVFQEVTGRLPRSFDQFVRDYRTSFVSACHK